MLRFQIQVLKVREYTSSGDQLRLLDNFKLKTSYTFALPVYLRCEHPLGGYWQVEQAL